MRILSVGIVRARDDSCNNAEFRGDGIGVCPVHPGWVRTDMGGAHAEISADESASGLFDLVESLTIRDTGQFWNWDGKRHPW